MTRAFLRRALLYSKRFKNTVLDPKHAPNGQDRSSTHHFIRVLDGVLVNYLESRLYCAS